MDKNYPQLFGQLERLLGTLSGDIPATMNGFARWTRDGDIGSAVALSFSRGETNDARWSDGAPGTRHSPWE